VQEIHNIRKAIPDPWFPSKPELRPLRDVSNLPVPVTIVEGSVDGTIPDEYVCRACGVRWVTFEAARECDHDERFRALEEIKNLEQWKPDNWEYKVLALKIHYVN
jgi:Ni2+-binding GTPase involved in maturation of urease and hydrogenase